MYEALLIHSLEVYRRAGEENDPTVQKKDRFGQPLAENPRQHVVGGETLVGTYPCRAYMSAGGLVFEERMIDTFERQFTVFTVAEIDLREDDAVRALDTDGRVIFGLSKIKDSEIKYDSTGPHHVELTIWEQAGPGEVAT